MDNLARHYRSLYKDVSQPQVTGGQSWRIDSAKPRGSPSSVPTAPAKPWITRQDALLPSKGLVLIEIVG